jgi:general secretion pathway protein B
MPTVKAVSTPPKPADKPVISQSAPTQQYNAEPEALRPDGLPFLKLTGIAYREKSTERMAIINDLPVMQGTAIEGAQLVEILQDEVILKWKEKTFRLKIEAE